MTGLDVRRARAADVPRIRAVLAPAVASGEILPRAVVPEDFLVAVDRDELVGVVALTPWTPSVVELGSLVSIQRGRGVGARLVEAALQWAGERGFHDVVALTAIDGWFSQQGFDRLSIAPGALARREPKLLTPPAPDAELMRATAIKATRSCASCARLARCQQILMHQPAPSVDVRRQRVA